uniref:Uncharacterized protein n=1 Tax=Anguilla anguilla TaxID=7936 RepID=A0A0E9SES1_ANGAN
MIFTIRDRGDSDPVGNITIMSVNPSHYRIIWADNQFRLASDQEPPRDCREEQIGHKLAQLSSSSGASITYR